jgi:hypothetical protein
MPAVLMMQIGLAALLLRLIPAWPTLGRRVQLPLFTAAALSLALNAMGTTDTLHQLIESQAQTGDISAISARLTADLPAREPVAAWDVAAWPLVGSGRHVVSIPWPEPMIADLGTRQRLNERLFDPRVTREERVAIARRLGTHVLIVDRRGSLDKRLGVGTLRRLLQGEQAVRNDGPLVRIDL